MRNLLLMFTIVLVQCCGTKKTGSGNAETATASVSDSTGVYSQNPVPGRDTTTKPLPSKTPQEKPAPGRIDLVNGTFHEKGLPDCLVKLTRSIMDGEVKNPATKIYSYTYKENKVYYVTPPCCDFFSDLLNGSCEVIAHPDGGITGKGDGRASDFIKTRSNEKLVWEDPRLPR